MVKTVTLQGRNVSDVHRELLRKHGQLQFLSGTSAGHVAVSCTLIFSSTE